MVQTLTVDFWSVIGPVGQIRATNTGFVNVLHCCSASITISLSISAFFRSHAVSNSTSIGRICLQPYLRVLICLEACPALLDLQGISLILSAEDCT